MTEPTTSIAEMHSKRGLDLLASGSPGEAIPALRAAIAANSAHFESYFGLIRALREAGRAEQSIAVALALAALSPNDPQAHLALSASLRQGGHIPEAEAAAARARLLEWKMQLESSSVEDSLK